MKVALYTRVSTEEQARHGLSMAEQLETLRRFALSQGYTISGEYSDPGISARKRYTRRPGLSRLLQDVQARKFDLILFIKLDRWVRSVRDYYQVQDILDSAGVSWKAVLEDYETVTASGRLKVNIMLSVAQDEADRTSERIKFVLDAKKAKGLRTNGRCPLGFLVEDSRMVPDPASYDIALQMFPQFVRLRSANAVRHWLAQQGFPRCYNTVRRYLSNPAYIPHVSPEDWKMTQDILAQRAQRCASDKPDRVYLFSGLLFCAECGKGLNSDTTIAHGQEYRYYRCVTHIFDSDKCFHFRRLREDKIEQYLLDNILPLAEGYNASIKSYKQPKGPDLSKIRAKMEKLKDLYLSDLIQRDVYARDYAVLQAQLDAAPPPAPQPVSIPALMDALSLYSSLSRPGKKEFWSRILSRVDVSNDFSFSVHFRL